MNGLISRVVRWWGACTPAGGPAPAGDAPCDPRRAALLLRACACVRVGALDEAEQLLESGLFDADDAARLNLAGVLCAKRGHDEQARRYYGRAVRADGRFAPAAQNLRRWFELDVLGRTKLPLLLGDEEPRLWWLRRRAVTAAAAAEEAEVAGGRRPPELGVHYHDN